MKGKYSLSGNVLCELQSTHGHEHIEVLVCFRQRIQCFPIQGLQYREDGRVGQLQQFKSASAASVHCTYISGKCMSYLYNICLINGIIIE